MIGVPPMLDKNMHFYVRLTGNSSIRNCNYVVSLWYGVTNRDIACEHSMLSSSCGRCCSVWGYIENRI